MYISIKVSSREEHDQAIEEFVKMGGKVSEFWKDEIESHIDRSIRESKCFVICNYGSIQTHIHEGVGNPIVYNSLEEFKTLTKH